MKPKHTRFLAFVLALCMALSALNVAVPAAAAEETTPPEVTSEPTAPETEPTAPETEPTAPETETEPSDPQVTEAVLVPGVTAEAVIASAGEYAQFSFIPEESGYYLFRSNGEGADTYGYIYDADMNAIASDDDSGSGHNFCVSSWLEAGQKYIFIAEYLGSGVTGSFPVVLEMNPIVAISAEPITIVDGTSGYWTYVYDSNEGVNVPHKYIYSWSGFLTYTVTFRDGISHTYTEKEFTYNGASYQVEEQDTQFHSDGTWAPGNTYDATISVCGISAQVSVTIVENQIASIVVNPVTVYPGIDSYTSGGIEYYNWIGKISYTVTMDDGTVLDCSASRFTYDGQTYSLDGYDTQSNNPWTAGTYSCQVYLSGLSASVDVIVAESPVESITVNPISIRAYTGGYYYEYDYQGEHIRYYHYSDWIYRLSYTLTMHDGTVVTGSGRQFTYNGTTYSLSISDPQNRYQYWLPGNTYTVTAWAMGRQFEISVTVEEVPFVSITANPISVYGDLDAALRTDTDENGQSQDWLYYNWENKLSYTVTFRDGTTLKYEDIGFWYNGSYYDMESSESQSLTNPWLPGNTYTESLSVADLTIPVSVTVTEPVVESVTVDPMTLTEGIDADATIGYHPETGERVEYAHYYWRNELSYTIHFTNGESLDCDWYYFTYQNHEYRVELHDTQACNAVWTGGNTYPVSLFIAGKSYESTVTIEQTPVVSVVAEPVVVYEDIHSSLASEYDSELGKTVYYNRYNWMNTVSYTVTFRDGTVVKGKGSDFEYRGSWYDIFTTDTQSADIPWKVGNSYTAQITVLGVSADVTVTVAENPVDRIVADPVYIAENTGGYESGGYDNNENYVNYYRYDWEYRLSFTVYFKDGTTLRQSDTGFMYDGIYHSVSCTDSQSARNPWIAGNTYLGTMEVFGKTAEVEVSIGTGTSEGRYEYMIASNGAIITYISSALEGEILEIPDSLGGYPVIGITSLGAARDNASEVIIPDSVTMLSDSLFDGWNMLLRKVQIGSGVSWLSNEMFLDAENLESITVSQDNPRYCSVEGVVYDTDQTVLVAYPVGKKDAHQVPDTVTDVTAVFKNLSRYRYLNIELGDGVTDYVTEDGVIYNADMTTLYFCAPSKTGTFVMPDTVTEIARCGFANTGLTEITVSPNVTSIVYGVFMGSKSLQKVNLPDNLQSIGLYAFQYCTALKSADIPASLTSIDSLAYDGCTGLEAVNIEDVAAWSQISFSGYKANPLYYARDLYLGGDLIADLTLPETGLDRISGYAFYNGSMTSVTIPGNVKSIGYCAFKESDLTSARLAEGIETINSSAFASTDLTTIDLPDSLTELGSSAFALCKNLATATIGSGLGEIGSSAFKSTALTTIVIPKNVTYIGWSAFQSSKLTQVIFENDSVEIGGYAFAYCPLKEINLGNGVSVIDECAFMGSHAAMVRIPDAVTDITYRSFSFSPNLMGVVIPAGVEYINTYAFEGDLNLSHVLYTGTQEQWTAIDVDSPELLNATLHCDAKGNEFTVTESCAAVKLYCSICQRTHSINKVRPEHEFVDGVCAVCGHEGEWEYEINTATKTVTITGYSGTDTAISIPASIRNMPVTAIADNAFYGRKELTAITIPGTVTTIGNSAFAQCSGLIRMTLPDSVTTLGSYAFAWCSSLETLTLSANLTALEDYTFLGCFKLGGMRIPASVTKLGKSVFLYRSDAFTFCGDAPEFDAQTFLDRYITCYYPASNPTWTEEVLQDYGGYDVTWIPLDVIPPVLTGTGFSLSFEDEVLVNFYYRISETENVVETGMAVFDSDPNADVNLETADERYNAAYDAVNQRYMSQTAGIAAKCMGDKRYYVAYAVLSDGSIAYSPVYQYNPRQYAEGRLANSSNTALKSLCVSMLNYGAQAQSFFGYRTGDLMNASLTEAQKALVQPYDAALFTGAVAADSAKIGGFVKTATGFSKKSASVSFEGAFSINYYFTPDAVVDGAMTFYYWTSEDYAAADKLSPANATGSIALTDSGNGTYWANIDGIAAKHLDKTYYVAVVYYSDLALQCTGVIPYSLSRYCINNAKPGMTMEALASATAMYGYYADQYFSK